MERCRQGHPPQSGCFHDVGQYLHCLRESHGYVYLVTGAVRPAAGRLGGSDVLHARHDGRHDKIAVRSERTAPQGHARPGLGKADVASGSSLFAYCPKRVWSSLYNFDPDGSRWGPFLDVGWSKIGCFDLPYVLHHLIGSPADKPFGPERLLVPVLQVARLISRLHGV